MTQKTTSFSMLYKRDERPFGKSWEEWATRWWQWFLSMPIDVNPACDKSGEKAGFNQNNPDVWFLAGTTGGAAERLITVPAGKSIFFPIINVTTSYLENPKLKTEDDMSSFVSAHMGDIAKKEASIDGGTLSITESYRVRSPSFKFSFPANNIYGAEEGLTRGVGDGYWIFLRPLSRGTHYISTCGACMSGKVQIDVNIKLIVE
jgi:hypothetical protein